MPITRRTKSAFWGLVGIGICVLVWTSALSAFSPLREAENVQQPNQSLCPSGRLTFHVSNRFVIDSIDQSIRGIRR